MLGLDARLGLITKSKKNGKVAGGTGCISVWRERGVCEMNYVTAYNGCNDRTLRTASVDGIDLDFNAR